LIRAVQHGVAVDRCARDRCFLLSSDAARSRQLNAKTLGSQELPINRRRQQFSKIFYLYQNVS
jgi:hypothetical protein